MKIEFATASDCLLLRQKILKPFLNLNECYNPGDLQPETFHLVYRSDDHKIICTASFEKETHPQWQNKANFRLRGMATDSEFQSKGIGALVLNKSFEILKEKNIEILWCNARIKAFSFYEKLGFDFHGDFFELPHIGLHKVMYKKL